ncbi:thiamine/thiamine pyrophosphate ABC transporter permease [Lacibacterium aquatile]|uniref:Thiamine transport system permease protein ThiP n=1 Tax=Lacibacterium aquatile TaxID=1168082 RepID=A0ABW5DPT2_9PROT
MLRQPYIGQPYIGLGLLTLIAAAVLSALASLWHLGIDEPFSLADPYLLSVVKFTLWQAALSSLISVLLAVPVARALARRSEFPGRGLMLRFFALPLVMPAIVVALAVVTLFGRSGWLNQGLQALGLPSVAIYGLPGILIAHVFFNMPLAARLLLTVLERIPAEHWRLAAQLGLSPADCFRRIEAPVLARALPAVAVLIFLLCSSSFTIVLSLGGGPAATTLEVAVYEALRSSFEPGRAAQLALVQLALTLICLILARRLTANWPRETDLGRRIARPDSKLATLADCLVLAVAAAFVGLPLVALLIDGLSGPIDKVLLDPDLRRALGRTLMIAIMAAPLSVLIAWGLLTGARAAKGRLRGLLTGGGDVVLTVPPLVLGTGWFLLLRPLTAPDELRLGLVIVMNALMALPFVLRSLGPAMSDAGERQNRLCAALGISGWNRFRLIDWPTLRRPLCLALGLAAALAAADFAAVALVGADDSDALPLLLHARMGSYRLNDASVIALILTLTGLVLLSFFDLGGRVLGRRHRA